MSVYIYLLHRSNPGSSGNQCNVFVLVGGPFVFGKRTFEGESLIDAHIVNIG